MSETVELLKSQAQLLSPDERADLANFLLTTLEPGDEATVSEAWVAEAKRRLSEYLSGKPVGVSAEQVLAELREQYP